MTKYYTRFQKQNIWELPSTKSYLGKITSLTFANSTCAFLQRNLRKCSLTIKSLAYSAYVRPIVEHASVVWSPHVKADISRIEMVQRKAAHFVFNDFSSYSSVSFVLTGQNWQSLELRRTKAIIIMFYKIINNLISINFSEHIHPKTSCTRAYLNKFISLSARLNCYYHSFLPHSIRLWNSLPNDLVTDRDLDSFSYKLNFVIV